MFAAMSYDAAMAIGRSVINGANSRAELRVALEQLGTKANPAVEGAGGRITFAKNHDIAGRAVVITTIGPARGTN